MLEINNITTNDYPTTVRAFLMIDYDHGNINRANPEPTSFNIPSTFIDKFPACELALLKLSERELEDFCVGEFTEHSVLMKRFPALTIADDILDSYFNDWMS